jgi:hypothetical protein
MARGRSANLAIPFFLGSIAGYVENSGVSAPYRWSQLEVAAITAMSITARSWYW